MPACLSKILSFVVHPRAFFYFFMNKIRTSISEMYIDEDGILRIEILEGADITLENIKKNFDIYKELLGTKRALLLIDSRVKYNYSKEARVYTASNQMELNRVAVAHIVRSLTSRCIISIYIRFNKPFVPTKMFTSEEKALKWLKSFYVLPGDKFNRPKRK